MAFTTRPILSSVCPTTSTTACGDFYFEFGFPRAVKPFLGESISLDPHGQAAFRNQELRSKKDLATKDRARVAWTGVWGMGDGNIGRFLPPKLTDSWFCLLPGYLILPLNLLLLPLAIGKSTLKKVARRPGSSPG